MNINRSEPRTLQTLQGEVVLWRNYVECRAGKRYRYPLDAELDLPAEGEATPQCGHDLCLLGVELPGKAGTRLLHALAGREVWGGMIHAQVQWDGAALVGEERREADQLWPYDAHGALRPVSTEGLARLHDPPPPDEAVVVEADGIYTNLGADPEVKAEKRAYEEAKELAHTQGLPFDQKKPTPFRETRNLRIYRLSDRVTKPTRSGGERTEITRSETISVVHDPDFFLRRANAIAHVWKVQSYPRRVLLGDGGDFIWGNMRTALAPTHEILDFRHAKGHVYECANALFGNGSSAAAAWAGRWSDSLYETGAEALLAELIRLRDAPPAPWAAEPARLLANCCAYVAEHQKRMDYPTYRTLGLPIASGAIESTNRQAVGDRCKRSGMVWSKSGEQHLLSLRVSLLSGTWGLACRAIRERRSYRRVTEQLARELGKKKLPTTTLEPAVAIPLDPENPRPPRQPLRTTESPGTGRCLVPERKLALRAARGLFPGRERPQGLDP